MSATVAGQAGQHVADGHPRRRQHRAGRHDPGQPADDADTGDRGLPARRGRHRPGRVGGRDLRVDRRCRIRHPRAGDGRVRADPVRPFRPQPGGRRARDRDRRRGRPAGPRARRPNGPASSSTVPTRCSGRRARSVATTAGCSAPGWWSPGSRLHCGRTSCGSWLRSATRSSSTSRWPATTCSGRSRTCEYRVASWCWSATGNGSANLLHAATGLVAAGPQSAADVRLAHALDGHEVLVYGSSEADQRRFARSLRNRLATTYAGAPPSPIKGERRPIPVDQGRIPASALDRRRSAPWSAGVEVTGHGFAMIWWVRRGSGPPCTGTRSAGPAVNRSIVRPTHGAPAEQSRSSLVA